MTCGISCSAIFYVTRVHSVRTVKIESNTYWWRSCKGKEAVGGEVRVVGVEDEADDSDEPLPDVVVAVGQTFREVEEVTHPHGDLKHSNCILNVGMCGAPQQQSLLTIVAMGVIRGW